MGETPLSIPSNVTRSVTAELLPLVDDSVVAKTPSTVDSFPDVLDNGSSIDRLDLIDRWSDVTAVEELVTGSVVSVLNLLAGDAPFTAEVQVLAASPTEVMDSEAAVIASVL